MKEKIKKIIKIAKNLFIFIGGWFFVSIWLTIFRDFGKTELEKDNLELSFLFRGIALLPLFILTYILAKKGADWRKRKFNDQAKTRPLDN